MTSWSHRAEAAAPPRRDTVERTTPGSSLKQGTMKVTPRRSLPASWLSVGLLAMRSVMAVTRQEIARAVKRILGDAPLAAPNFLALGKAPVLHCARTAGEPASDAARRIDNQTRPFPVRESSVSCAGGDPPGRLPC